MRRGRLWDAAALLIGLILAACSRAPAPDAVATVNGEPVPRKVFDARLAVRLRSLKAVERREPTSEEQTRIRKEVLEELVGRQLLVQAARREGEAVSAEEVDAAVEELRHDFSAARAPIEDNRVGGLTASARQPIGRRDTFLDSLRERGITQAELRADMEANLLARRFVARLTADVVADEAEARRYYEAHTPKFHQPAQYRLRVIAVANEREARVVAADIRREKTTFAQEAERRARGIFEGVRGEMGWVELATLPREMARIVADLKSGEFGGPVIGKESVYLVQLVDKREAVETPFEKIKADLVHVVRQEKRAAKVRDWVARQRAAAQVVLADDLR